MLLPDPCSPATNAAHLAGSPFGRLASLLFALCSMRLYALCPMLFIAQTSPNSYCRARHLPQSDWRDQ